MNSENDLPHQPDAFRQQPPLAGKNKSRKWKYFFIALAVINILWLIPISSQPVVAVVTFLTLGTINDFFTVVLGALGYVLILFFPITAVDFIALLTFRIIHRPQGKSKDLTDAILFFIGLVLVFGGIAIFEWFSVELL